MLKIANKIDEIINDFKEGCSSIEINKKYGDFGEFVLSTYVTQSISITQVFYSWNEKTMKYNIDLLKVEIIKSFIDGTNVANIKKKYGEYGIVCVDNFRKFYKELIPKY